VDENDRIIGFEEKPEISAAVSMGVYVMEPDVLDYIPAEGHSDFPDLAEALLQAGCEVASYPYQGLWFDIGRHDDFQQAVTAWTNMNGSEYEKSERVLLGRSLADEPDKISG
jgi:mannose-1-phosphate guanylyltransferase